MSKKFGFVPLVAIGLLLFFPSMSFLGAKKGIEVWAENIVPTLFPFMTVSMMLQMSGIIQKTGAFGRAAARFLRIPEDAFGAVLSGMISGYPVGARLVSSTYKDKKCECDIGYLAAVSSFASPAFILGTVGAKLVGDGTVGVTVIASHYISFIVTVLLMRPEKENCFYENYEKTALCKSRYTVGMMLKQSVESGVMTILLVGGYTVLFSIATEFITNIGFLPKNGLIRCLVSALTELSGGCADIASSGLAYSAMVPFLCFAVTWGGLCVCLQINGFVSDVGGKVSTLIKFKCVQAAIATAVGWLLAMLL